MNLSRFALIALIATSIALPAFAGETVAVRKGTKSFQVVSKTETAPTGGAAQPQETASVQTGMANAADVAAITPAAGVELGDAQGALTRGNKPVFAHSLPRK